VICRLYHKHLVNRTETIPLAEAVEQYLSGDWGVLVEALEWPPLEELLADAPRISRADLRQRLVALAAEDATARLDAIEEESASDEEIAELALDEVELDAEDLAALDTHLGERLLADALSLYGEALASRITE